MSIVDSLMGSLHSLEGFPAYALLFGLLFGSGFGLPINEDILLLGAAALTLKGVMDPIPLIAVAWFGVLTADTLIFHWGHRFGARMLQHRLFARLVPPRRVASMQAAMLRYGPGYIFLARFMPGIRTALYFAAGSLKMPYRHQFIFDGAAAAVELPLLVYGVRYLGGRWDEIMAFVGHFQAFLVPGILLLVLGVWLIRAVR
ncbi:DedA family protein [Caenimonas soli]|uniref:DedA family protein n=1 Tax=Caenimonas soli TaxID=2735555 RepID=UPI0015537995|nr:DedA family protein [Caenimonas soli]NPC54550.1 DedA family protein [Caenimonas soli]